MVILHIKDLIHHFADGSHIPFPDLTLETGERLLIMGPSGCGKSTLLNLISGVLPTTHGHIQLLDHAYESLSSRDLDRLRADHMGVIFQTLNLIPHLSARANASLSLRFSTLRSERIDNLQAEYQRLVKALGLSDHLLNKLAKHLSIGQQQRIAAMRALLGHPELILADEPTSALDPDSSHQFMRELLGSFDRSRQGLVMVSHNPELTKFFDRVVQLEAHL